MKQIIDSKLAEELGITATSVCEFFAVEDGVVVDKIKGVHVVARMLEGGAEYIGTDRSRLVGWGEAQVPVPWTQEDVPPVCWLRMVDSTRRQLVLAAYPSGVGLRSANISYGILAKEYEWSVDTITWKSCTKEQ